MHTGDAAGYPKQHPQSSTNSAIVLRCRLYRRAMIQMHNKCKISRPERRTPILRSYTLAGRAVKKNRSARLVPINSHLMILFHEECACSISDCSLRNQWRRRCKLQHRTCCAKPRRSNSRQSVARLIRATPPYDEQDTTARRASDQGRRDFFFQGRSIQSFAIMTRVYTLPPATNDRHLVDVSRRLCIICHGSVGCRSAKIATSLMN